MKARDISQITQLLIDLITICFAWRIAVYARTVINPLAGVSFNNARPDLWAPSLGAILFSWLVIAFWLKLYKAHSCLHPRWIMRRALEATVVLSCVTVLVTFFSREGGIAISRTFVFVLFPITLLCFAAARLAAIMADRRIYRSWPVTERIAIVGEPSAAARLADVIRRNSGTARIHGLIVTGVGLAKQPTHSTPILGTTSCLGELINTERLDRLIIVDRLMSDSELEHCSKVSHRMGIAVSCAVGYSATIEKFHFSIRDGVPLVNLTPVIFSLWQEWVKRALDVALAIALLMALAPIMLSIAILIRATSVGPVLYKSPRVGRGGRHFTFLKFRSMYTVSSHSRQGVQNEKSGHIFKMRNDPRVTPLGNILRRYSLDELPQLINVIRGEMSIVGPRPLPAQDLDPDGMSREFAVWAEQRARVYPGITGLWQIRGRSDLPFEDMITLDLEYIQTWSLFGDFRILLETPALVLNATGAY